MNTFLNTNSLLWQCALLGAGMFVIHFFIAKKLRSPGTVFRIEDAIGKEAMIYQRIPKGGSGKISVSLHHFTYELDAISFEQEDLPSFTFVQIIEKFDEKTVIVAMTR